MTSKDRPQPEIDNNPKWTESDGSYYLALPKAKGVRFLGAIAKRFDRPFQELIEEVSGQVVGETAFLFNGKRVDCRLSLAGSKKFEPYNRLWILFWGRIEIPSNSTDQGGITFDFEKELSQTESAPSLKIHWDFEHNCVSVSRKVISQNSGSLTVRFPMGYSDTPDIMPGLRATKWRTEIGYPFVLEQDSPKIIVPTWFSPNYYLLLDIRDDIRKRGVVKS